MDCCVALQTKVVPCQHVVLQTANRSLCHMYVARLTRCWTTTRMRKKLRRKQRQNPSRRLWRCDLRLKRAWQTFFPDVTGKFLKIQGSSRGTLPCFHMQLQAAEVRFAQFLRRLMSGRCSHTLIIFSECIVDVRWVSFLSYFLEICVVLSHPIP